MLRRASERAREPGTAAWDGNYIQCRLGKRLLPSVPSGGAADLKEPLVFCVVSTWCTDSSQE